MQGMNDTRYFTGNSILSKYVLFESRIFRDPLGPYFDRRANGVNAKGYERRLGGRMGLFAKIAVPGLATPIVLGNVHTVSANANDILQYIGMSKAIVGGDQNGASCGLWGLQLASTSSTPTWPATCGTYGKGRGDIVCTNVGTYEDETVNRPCLQPNGINVTLGDHAFIVQDFEIG